MPSAVTRLALDTNAYVELLRDGPRAGAVRALLFGTPVSPVLLGPVLAELRLGARNAREVARIDQSIVRVTALGHRLAPDAAEWGRAGDVVRAMRDAGGAHAELGLRSFFVDVVVAVLCRGRGVTLVTDDDDHARIRAYVGHRVVQLPRV